MNYKKELGSLGERLAARYLLTKGYKILARNWRGGHKEIDLIAVKDGLTIFFEVKTRGIFAGRGAKSSQFSQTEAILRPRQLKILKQAISFYAYQRKINLESVRLDLIIINFDRIRRAARLKHVRNLF